MSGAIAGATFGANPRRRDGGVTLIEILVVLALLGVMAGVISLGLGRQSQDRSLQEEANLLSARMNRAADHILLTGQKMQIIWAEDQYTFKTWSAGEWAPHPIGILANDHLLSGDIRLGDKEGRQAFVVDAGLIPQDGQALTLMLRSLEQGQEMGVIFDGANARIADRNSP